MNYIQKKIKLIKKIREKTLKLLGEGIGLKASKDFIDKIQDHPVKIIYLLNFLLFEEDEKFLLMIEEEDVLSTRKEVDKLNSVLRAM